MKRKGLTKVAVKALKTSVPKKPTIKEQLETLKATIREYFNQLRYRQPEYTIKLPAKIVVENNVPKDHAVNVPSLIASVVTAQGLGKEIRVKAVQDPTGGALIIEFYTPVQVERNGPLLLS